MNSQPLSKQQAKGPAAWAKPSDKNESNPRGDFSFNIKEHPENTNIKLTNLQSPFMDYFKNGIWNKVEQRVMIPRIISKSVKVINEIMSSQDEEEEKEQKWYKYVNGLKDTNLQQKLKMKTKKHLYNKTTGETDISLLAIQ